MLSVKWMASLCARLHTRALELQQHTFLSWVDELSSLAVPRPSNPYPLTPLGILAHPFMSTRSGSVQN